MKKQKTKSKNRVSPSPTLRGPLSTASVCSTDRPLFRALGLPLFSDIPTGEDYYVGEVKFENESVVKVWVCPMPALFWKAEINCNGTKKVIRISTGSGALVNFWQSIRLIAEGMLDIDSVG